MTTAHPIISIPITPTKYPIYVRNDGTHVILIENSSFYNTYHVESLEGNPYNGLKVIHVSFGVRKHVVVTPMQKY
jgi:hypothetical protein